MEVGTTTMALVQALTANYALQENSLNPVHGALNDAKYLLLYGENQTSLDITYTTGAGETSNYVELYIEFGSGDPKNVTWAPETVEYLDDSADQIVLETWTYKIEGAAAATAYSRRIQLPVCTKGIRIYAKEVGIAANAGTLTIKSNNQKLGASDYNRSLQTVVLETGGTSLDVNIDQIGGVAPPLDGGAFTPGASPVIAAGVIYDDDAVLADGQVGAARATKNREQINAGYEASPNSNRVGRVDPEWSHNLPYSVVLTNVPNATPAVVYIDMTGYTGCSIHVEKTGGGDTFAGTFSSGNEGSASTDDFIDTTANGWSPATAGGLTADFIYHTNKAFRATAHALTLTTAGAADDADFNVFIYKW